MTLVACGGGETQEDTTRNFRIPTTTSPFRRISPLRVPRLTLPPPRIATTTTVATVDGPTPEEIEATLVASGGNPLLAPGARENPYDCYDLVVEALRGSKLSGGLVAMFDSYLRANNVGPFDCDDPGEHIPSFEQWLLKLIPVETPEPALELIPEDPIVARDRDEITWRVRIAPGFDAIPDVGFIYAYDIEEDQDSPLGVSATYWLYDHAEYSIQDCIGGDWSPWRAMAGQHVTEVTIPIDEYEPGSVRQCLRARVQIIGTEFDDRISSHVPRSGEKVALLPDVDEEDLVDPFVVVGFGDSYGSGEGNPYVKNDADEDYYDDCLDSIEDSVSTSARCDVELWWEPDALSEVGINDTALTNAGACHRSSESGLSKAIQKLWENYGGEITYGHFACSGATSGHIWREKYEPGFWDDPTWMPVQITEALDWLETVDRSASEVDAVVVSIGGNDVGFSDVIYDCFIEAGDCNDEDDTIELYDSILVDIPEAINTVVVAVRSNFPNAEVYFTLYTDGISVNPASSYDEDSDGVCSYDDDPWFSSVPYDSDEFWDILADDSRFVRNFLVRLNQTITDTVAQIDVRGARRTIGSLGFHYQVFLDEDRPQGAGAVQVISGQFDRYRNNGFCTRSRRNIVFNDEAIDNQGADQYGFWSSGGWHPNDQGHRQYAESIVEALARDFAGDEYTNLGRPR